MLFTKCAKFSPNIPLFILNGSCMDRFIDLSSNIRVLDLVLLEGVNENKEEPKYPGKATFLLIYSNIKKVRF